jgi:cobalt-zinc-cadmium efflux system protein
MAHSHHHGRQHRDEKRLLFVMLLTGIFMLVEVVGGLLSGSLALLADAGHMATDTLALALAWLGFVIGRRLADERRSYGYRRFEVLAAWVNGVALIGLTIWIAIEAVRRVWAPTPVLGAPMLAIAVAGLAVNLIVLRILRHGDHHNLNMRAAALHVLGDLLGSVGAIAAAVVILLTGWTPIDPILSLFVAALILRSAWMLVKQSTHILLEGTPEGLDIDAIRAELEAELDEVVSIHHVHAWSLTSGTPLITLHVQLREGADASAVLAELKRILRERYDLDHSVIQLERGACPDRNEAPLL